MLRLILPLLPLFLTILTLDVEANDGSMAATIPYEVVTGSKTVAFCPCHFEPVNVPKDAMETLLLADNTTTMIPVQKTGTYCAAVVPASSAMTDVTQNHTDEDGAPLEGYTYPPEPFNAQYVSRACLRFGRGQNYTALLFDSQSEAGANNVKSLPALSLFFIKHKPTNSVHCTYVDGETGNVAPPDDCQNMMDNHPIENVLCYAPPLINKKPKCRCPCGFKYSFNDSACISMVTGCDALESPEGMFILAFSMSTVALVARITDERTEPPEDWPTGSLFFVGDPAQDICGFKNESQGGKLSYDNCSEFFAEFAFYSVLCMAPMDVDDSECPEPVKIICTSGAVQIHAVPGFWMLMSVALFLGVLTELAVRMKSHDGDPRDVSEGSNVSRV